ncbi:hypothetical protein [Fervidibacillus halotolerans]|uniref:Copper amine oxidase-like N-terminal domain-containing protein n=1 Tax=Fervidibacillus halotolerans TaxID=2980027 RepID=A0A9E8M1K0_9BACI|nr:hypothetical protein [Fervidibacillus halotolerans]WAA13707.1 hypothetical protein OE105_06290 [Fervidibacillus halotolerans]
MAKRNLFSIFIIALLLTTVLLIWQWNDYQMKAKKGNGTEPIASATQQIEITHSKGKLTIVQRIENLEMGNYHLRYPDGENFICESGGKRIDCSKEMMVEENEIQFTYEIHMNPDYHFFMLDDGFVKLENVSVDHTEVHMSEMMDLDSIWIAGADMKTDQKMEFVHYYLFEKEGEGFSLYWQRDPLTKTQQDGYTVYGNRDFQWGKNLVQKFFNDNQNRIIPNIVFTDIDAIYSSKDLLVVPETIDENKLQRLWINEYFSEGIFQSEKENEWLAEVLTGLFFQIPINGKAEEMYEQLVANLNEEEINRFFEKINTVETSGVKGLDERLSEVKQWKTDFFTLNKNQSNPLEPLYFYMEKPIFVGEEQLIDKKVYVVRSTHYYPVKEIVQSLGYTYEPLSDHEILVSNKKDVFRFYDGKNIFILNEEQYGLYGDHLEEPLTKIHGEWYIQEDLLIRLFSVQVIEYESKIAVF